MNIKSSSPDLVAEAILADDIQFQQPVSEHFSEPQAILLTGATGFLGAHLLDELLSNSTAKIYCLIRCKEGLTEAKQRLQVHLEFYSLWKKKFSARIIPIIGDLSQALLGLSVEQFERLATEIDRIYHNGAWVNSVYPYAMLKASNVNGTIEILRLAGHRRTKSLHFVSTIAVFFNGNNNNSQLILETDCPSTALKGGYKQSKWVAENLVMAAQQRGLPANIYRVGRIMGHSKTGINGNFNDLLMSMIKVCILVKKYPDWETSLSLITVDYTAQSLVKLSELTSNIFHLLNPKNIDWQDFFTAIQALGYPLEKVSHNQWQVTIQHYVSENKDHKLNRTLRFLLNASNTMRQVKPKFDMNHSLTALANCPEVSQELITTWLQYLQNCGQIPPPLVNHS